MEAMQDGEEAKLPRVEATYMNRDAPFHIEHRTYERQYAQLYFARLNMMKPALHKQIAHKWPHASVAAILQVGAHEEGTDLVVIGTLFKEMRLRPSILDDYIKDRGVASALAATSFCADDDKMVLEDEGARMALTGSVLPVQDLVTGIVVAVRGVCEPGGAFDVRDVCYPNMAEQVPRPVLEEDKYVALISGLRLSSQNSNDTQLRLVLEMLAGDLGSEEAQRLASKIVRVVVAGGCIGSLDTLANTTGFTHQQNLALQPIRDLDMIATDLAAALPVDIMPGAQDPTNVALPQQPLHKCLFPNANAYGSLVRATNPHCFDVDGVQFLGTSGQPIDDLVKYSRQTDRLAQLEACLRWRHLAPTAPDTLTSYPFDAADPFIIQATPHVFFAGCQPHFGARTVQGPEGQSVLAIAVPSFERTGTLVLLNLRTLEAQPFTMGPDL